MARKKRVDGAKYMLGFDGGGTKTECLLADANGKVLAGATMGPSNPLRVGYAKAWAAIGEAGKAVLGRRNISAAQIGGICAGLGGAGRPAVVGRMTAYFRRSFPRAEIFVVTDLEIALDAAFGAGEGILLLAGTGSAAFGRDAGGRLARAGGRGPWFSDEGSAFDIGREAVRAVSLADEHRGPETALIKRIFGASGWRDWANLLEAISKNADDVFPRIFPFVAELADKGDAVSRRILTEAAASLAGLAHAVAKELGCSERAFDIAKSGGVYGRSKFFDAAIAAEVTKLMPHARLVRSDVSPAEAAVRMAVREMRAKGNAA